MVPTAVETSTPSPTSSCSTAAQAKLSRAPAARLALDIVYSRCILVGQMRVLGLRPLAKVAHLHGSGERLHIARGGCGGRCVVVLGEDFAVLEDSTVEALV